MKNNNNNTNNLLESALVLARIFYTAFKNGFEIERIEEALIDSLLPDTPPRTGSFTMALRGVIQAYVEQGLPFTVVVDDAVGPHCDRMTYAKRSIRMNWLLLQLKPLLQRNL